MEWRSMISTEELVGRGRTFERHRDDLEDRPRAATIAGRWVEHRGHAGPLPETRAIHAGHASATTR